MTKIILIGGANMAPVLASLQAQDHNVKPPIFSGLSE